ncbi:CRP-like cAMP-binding protein [Rhodopseudomonas thermotolerans]|uniref:CRP-like cAMP-binding protein n=2 Tax=Rhodopseudomonas TaxID=1073 RepID=A0A336JSQ3_9BRAD|nr:MULTISPECIES: Crp/Fnr family transcriptional regulator [Rhodopseudomonas]RED33250.1 CRP-like cAMP-binding protein [Rhodopseudomonas pentothenatexigens]REF93999.1 CRP-like cAMP-binding protein [Rhodopseudomonas thermotolerans]SSW91326.1 CRP-like cAMP-binding protein [Rhodopseudomonas pentothenatexigens]
MRAGFAFTSLANRLASVAELSEQDLELLTAMPATIRHLKPHETVLHQNEDSDECCVVLQGFLCWRQGDRNDALITSIHIPGDVPDLHTILAPCRQATLNSLGPAVVALVPHEFFRSVAAQSRQMANALAMLALADVATLRNWVVNLGARDSLTRVTHLLCEIATRLQAVGLARDYRFPSPFTQSDLAAACGISAVHANRIIQDLRHSSWLQWHAKTITITNWNALVRVSGFTPDYLHLRREPQMQCAADALAPCLTDRGDRIATPLS